MRRTFQQRLTSPSTKILAGATIALLLSSAAHAAVLTWDAVPGTAGIQDGAGTWQVGAANWRNVTTATDNQNWADANDAVFGGGTTGTAGAVTVVGTVAPTSLTFNTPSSGNYAFSGGTITTSLITTNANATINSGLGGSSGVTKNGFGTLTLSPTTADAITGGVTISLGTLQLTYSNMTTPTNMLASSNALNLGGYGSTLSLTGKASAATTTSQTFAGTTLNAGQLFITAAQGNASQANNLINLNLAAITRNAGAAVNVTLPTGSGTNQALQNANNGILTTTANTNTSILAGWATVNKTDWAVSGGNGTTAGNITALASYSANSWTSGANTDITTLSPSYSGTTNSVRFNTSGAATVTLTAPAVITSGGILVTNAVGANVQTITGSTLTSGSGELDINSYAATANSGLTIASAIVDNGVTPTSVLINSTGPAASPITLSGNNTYTGTTYIAGNTKLNSGSGYAIPGNVTLLGGATTQLLSNQIAPTAVVSFSSLATPILDLAGTNLTIAGLSGSTTGTVQNGTTATTSNLTFNTPTASTFLFTGSLKTSGTAVLNIIKNGGGKQILAVGGNTGTNWTINAGILQFDTLNTISSAELPAPQPGGLIFNNGATFVISNENDTANRSGIFSGGFNYISGDNTILTSQDNTNFTMSTGVAFNGGTRSPGATINYTVTGGTAGTTNILRLTNVTGFANQGEFYNGADYAYGTGSATAVRAPVYGTDANFVIAGSALLPNNNLVTSPITNQGTISTLGTVKFGGSGPVNLTLANGATVTLGVSGKDAGLLRSGGGTTTISGGTALKPINNQELVVRTDVAADKLTITTPIVANGFNALTKSGAGTLTLGGANTYTGSTFIDGGTLAISNDNNLGAAYDGSLAGVVILSGGTNYAAGTTTVAIVAPPSGTTAVAGTVTVAGGGITAIPLSNTGTGYLASPKVTISSSGTGSGAAATALVKGLLTFSGGILQTTAGVTSSRAVDLLANGGTIDTDGVSSTFSGVFFDAGGLTVTSSAAGGVLALSGTSTYTGATTITSGQLTIASTGTINSTSGISIGAGEFNYNSSTALSQGVTFSTTGGTLSGGGTITPAVSVTTGNFLAPGNGIGTLSFGTGLTIAGTYSAQLGTPGATPAAGVSDRAAVTGNLTLTGGTLALSDNANANSQGSAGAGAYRLITFTGSRTGNFATVTNPLSATLHEVVTYNGTTNGTVDLSLFRLATATAPGVSKNLGNVRVGTALAGSDSIANSASNDGFTELLKANVTGSGTGFANVSGGASGTVNYSLATSTAGPQSGGASVVLASTGAGTYADTTLSTTSVALTGNAYRYATGSLNTTSINLGVVHKGDVLPASAVKISNTALTDGYSDNLSASLASYSNNTGTLTGVTVTPGASIAAGASNSTAATVSFNTGTAGTYNGSIAANLISTPTVTGPDTNHSVATGNINLLATVNDYAKPVYATSGSANWVSPTTTSYKLNLGTLTQTTSTSLTSDTFNVLNQLLSSYQDSLSGTFGVTGGSGFSLTGNSFSLAGGSNGNLTINFDQHQSTGSYQEFLSFTPTSHNTSSDTTLTANAITVELDAFLQPGTTSTTYTLSTAAAKINLLAGATTTITSTITNSGTGLADSLNYTGLTGIGGAGTSSGPLAQNASGTNSQAYTATAGSYGDVVLSATVASATNATLGGNASQSGSTTSVTIHAGDAIADNSGTGSFLAPALSASVSSGGNLGGLSSKAMTVDSQTGGSTLLGTTANILASTGGDATGLSMGWRTRKATETFGNPAASGFALYSDVVQISFVDPTAPQYILELSWSPTLASSPDSLYIGELISGTWSKEGSINEGTQSATAILSDPLGAYGYDSTNNSIFVVTNHAGTFGVIPEPASLGLLAIGAISLLGRRRRN